MQDELERYLTALGIALLAGVCLFFLRIALSIVLRMRVAPGLLPGVREAARQDAMPRFISLVGTQAKPTETLGTLRLRTTLGLRLLFWGVATLIAGAAVSMQAPLVGVETAILALVVYLAVHTTAYEIRYDSETLSLPRWWFGHTTRKWRELDAAVEWQKWHLAFHFRDGTVVQAHKYVVGYAALREKAEAVLREV